MLVADDNSPDGTGEIADDLAAADDHVHVHAPPGQGGPRAPPTWRGFDWALDNGFDVVVEMDADGSHQPEQLPRCCSMRCATPTWCSARAGCPAARWSTGRSRREVLSRGGNLYTRLMLGIPLRDATGGYRAFRADALRGSTSTAVGSAGYCFQVELGCARVDRRAAGRARCPSTSSSASSATAR